MATLISWLGRRAGNTRGGRERRALIRLIAYLELIPIRSSSWKRANPLNCGKMLLPLPRLVVGPARAGTQKSRAAGALRVARASATLLALSLVTSLAAEVAWIDVPFVRQVRAGCGPAAVAMVMQYWVQHQAGLDAVAVDAEHINEALPASSRGTFGNDLKQYLEAHGFSAYVFDGEPKDLDSHVAKGRPLVVCLGPKGADGPLHYVVVVGTGDHEILLNDSARGKLIRERRKAFLQQWKATGNWTLLAVPRPAR